MFLHSRHISFDRLLELSRQLPSRKRLREHEGKFSHQTGTVTATLTSDRFDRLFWERLWRLIRPYWTSDKRAQALVMITIMTVLSLGTVGMQAIFSYVSRDVMNALQAKDAARFYHLMMLFGVWIVIFVPIAAFYPYVTGLLSIDWRDWLTETFVRRMLHRNALYHIMRDHTVDNPDQRISEDVNSFTSDALNYAMTILQGDRNRD